MRASVSERRERARLTQAELAERVGISRQALGAIEAGRSAPSTPVALRLARELDCRVEDLFALDQPPDVLARVVGGPRAGARGVATRIDGQWIAHRLTADDRAANVIVDGDRIQFLDSSDKVAHTLLLAGCAPIMGLIADRGHRGDSRGELRWIPATSGQALRLLEERLVHVAGLHLYDARSGEYNVPQARTAMPGRELSFVTLARWELGLAVPKGNPLGITDVSDFARPDLRIVSRPIGAGARDMLERELTRHGVERSVLASCPEAVGHEDVAWRVAVGVADTGPTIRAAAIAAQVDFIPLCDERFDLVLDTALLGQSSEVLVELLRARSTLRELANVPGYDVAETGTLVGEIR